MTSQNLISWLVGLVGVSLLLGSICSWAIWKNLHAFFKSTAKKRKWDVKWDETEMIPIYPFLLGVFERVFFTVIVAFNISGAAIAIVTWMLIKMATGWNRISMGGETWRRMLSFTGLISSMTSLFFAVLGGLIVNCSIPITNTAFRVIERDAFVQLLSVAITLIGTFMVAFGYRVKPGISNDLRKEVEIDKKDLIVPTDVKNRPWIFYMGLVLLLFAALFQVLVLSSSFREPFLARTEFGT